MLPRTTFSWNTTDLSLANAAGTNKQTLVIQPFTAAGSPVFNDGASATFNVTATAGGRRPPGPQACWPRCHIHL
jgi:hypothetical protein